MSCVIRGQGPISPGFQRKMWDRVPETPRAGGRGGGEQQIGHTRPRGPFDPQRMDYGQGALVVRRPTHLCFRWLFSSSLAKVKTSLPHAAWRGAFWIKGSGVPGLGKV